MHFAQKATQEEIAMPLDMSVLKKHSFQVPMIETLAEAINALTFSDNLQKIAEAKAFIIGPKGLESNNKNIQLDTLVQIKRLDRLGEHLRHAIAVFENNPANTEVIAEAKKHPPLHVCT